MEKIKQALQQLLIVVPLTLIKCYQWFISPILGQRCRFHPSCSWYAIDALKTHGLVKGGWLSIKRILKCHPFNPGGVDPVPEPRNNKHSE